MASLKIEGNLDGVSDEQREYTRIVIEKLGFKDATAVFEVVGQAGDNYVANVKRIVIQGNDGSTLNLIAKIAPNIEAIRQMINTQVLFKNEHIMYTKVLPKFEQLQKSADIPEKERLKFAKCYGSYEKAPNEVILLEDLKVTGFEMLDRLRSLSDVCVRSVLKNFAILHSCSYALKHKEPAVFDDFKNELVDMWAELTARDDMKVYIGQIKMSTLAYLESNTHKKIINDILPTSFLTAGKLLISERESKHAVIQQGDAWTNNILFKFEEGSLLESIMIDYQASRVSNPAIELEYMLFNCTDYNLRKEYFHDWIDYYHSELGKSLSNFGLKANYIYPKDQLDADLKRYGKLGLGLSLMLGNATLLKPEEALKMKEAMESNDMDKLMKTADLSEYGADSVALFKSRSEGLLKSFIELGIISA